METNISIDKEFKGFLKKSWLKSIVRKVLLVEHAQPTAEVGLVITGQDRIRELNRTYLGRDRPTDVLSFAMLPGADESQTFVPPPDGKKHLGEIVISYLQAETQAREHGHSIKKELAILIIHGTLHLLGYDHDVAERRRTMRKKESEILAEIEGGLE